MATDTLHPFMRDDARGETSMRGDAPEVTSVTIVLTTSPCRSHPSTMLIEETVSSIADAAARLRRRGRVSWSSATASRCERRVNLGADRWMKTERRGMRRISIDWRG